MSQTARTLDAAQPHQLRPIMEVGKTFGLLESELISYGPYKAKISLDRGLAASNSETTAPATYSAEPGRSCVSLQRQPSR